MMTDKIVMVTGANSGIGRVTAKELAKQGATVVMVCRNPLKGKAVQEDINAQIGVDRVHLLLADFSSHESIRKMTEQFKSQFERLDVLVNNAGLIIKDKIITEDGFEYSMGVNHFGYFLNTHYLLDVLKESNKARIVNVASMAHRMATQEWDNMNGEKSFQYFRQYCLTKLCNVQFSNQLAKYLEGTSITTNSLHPGMVNSNFGNEAYPSIVNTFANLFMVTPQKGAETSIHLASSSEVKNITGAYFANSKRRFPSSLATNSAACEKLWNWSLEQTNIDTFGK
ncbi:MAG TPA: SDR family oxidoreductase [Chitinophagales bacterium]|nr:SDR family oxidoreductase [Chitinophagales bacterium]